MAVDQLQQATPTRPAEPAGRMNEPPSGTGSHAEGRRRTLLFAAIIGGAILLTALGFWIYSRAYETTDDAQVAGHLSGISARIDGDIKAVHVEENQSVKAGDLLFEIDPTPYQDAVDSAEAEKIHTGALLGRLLGLVGAGGSTKEQVDEAIKIHRGLSISTS